MHQEDSEPEALGGPGDPGGFPQRAGQERVYCMRRRQLTGNIKVKRVPQVSSARQRPESASPPPWEDALLPQPVLRCELPKLPGASRGLPAAGGCASLS